ncbi:unnamed protein product [Protopolystoma xenopodis]|uniref:Uncharacterized protein n=1 Tax=Protopolystoma xenopodis TaxID=117903 RepID=A0A448WFD3_9PLAT|nr:unnamed protein product [Protopolystoma xenopodis]
MQVHFPFPPLLITNSDQGCKEQLIRLASFVDEIFIDHDVRLFVRRAWTQPPQPSPASSASLNYPPVYSTATMLAINSPHPLSSAAYSSSSFPSPLPRTAAAGLPRRSQSSRRLRPSTGRRTRQLSWRFDEPLTVWPHDIGPDESAGNSADQGFETRSPRVARQPEVVQPVDTDPWSEGGRPFRLPSLVYSGRHHDQTSTVQFAASGSGDSSQAHSRLGSRETVWRSDAGSLASSRPTLLDDAEATSEGKSEAEEVMSTAEEEEDASDRTTGWLWPALWPQPQTMRSVTSLVQRRKFARPVDRQQNLIMELFHYAGRALDLELVVRQPSAAVAGRGRTGLRETRASAYWPIGQAQQKRRRHGNWRHWQQKRANLPTLLRTAYGDEQTAGPGHLAQIAYYNAYFDHCRHLASGLVHCSVKPGRFLRCDLTFRFEGKVGGKEFVNLSCRKPKKGVLP